MMEFLRQPWTWYAAGIIIGLIVPALLILGNKHFGISSNMRHICAACFPANIPYFKYNWKKEIWNFFFVAGVMIGALIAAQVLTNDAPLVVNQHLSVKCVILFSHLDNNVGRGAKKEIAKRNILKSHHVVCGDLGVIYRYRLCCANLPIKSKPSQQVLLDA